MKLRSFFSVLVASVLVLLLVGASGFYWLTARSPLALLRGGSTDGPAAAMFVPKQAPAVVSLLVNPERLEAFRQVIAAPGARRQSRAEIEQLKQSLLANTGLDYKQDVEPWLGDEITLALTSPDVDRDAQTGQQPGYLLAIATQNPERSREFLQLFWQKRVAAGTRLMFEQYKGVKLIYSQPEPPVEPQKPETKRKKNKQQEPDTVLTVQPATTLSTAVVSDRFVLFANQPKVLRDAINNVQAAELGLGSSPAYQQALQSFKQRQIGLVFLNLPQLAAWSSQGTADATTEASNLYESVAIGLGLSRKGLLAETAFLAAPGQTLPAATPALSKPTGALAYIPASSPVAAAGTDLEQFWTQVSSGVSSYETLAQLINQPLNNLRNAWQLDLPQDIFSWVKGEYAVALLPRPEQQPDWVFVAERTEAATTAIANLDTLAKDKGFSVGPLTLADRPVSAWTKLGSTPLKAASKTTTEGNSALLANVIAAEVEGVHATVGNYEIFATSVAAMEQALQATKDSLVDSPGFKAAIAALPKDNDGYLYLDWANSRSILEQQLPFLRLVELASQPFWNQLRSLTVTSLGGESGVRRSEVFLNLSPTDKA
ncbi:DUF3352 domain-containing protein [Trichocoleus desertorum AS-A10]|uniref:DUF3352 domain-containing protein n=1 Tax=Trichocoleus desertorum TaxID=1481672 RepID=UPI003299E78E